MGCRRAYRSGEPAQFCHKGQHPTDLCRINRKTEGRARSLRLMSALGAYSHIGLGEPSILQASLIRLEGGRRKRTVWSAPESALRSSKTHCQLFLKAGRRLYHALQIRLGPDCFCSPTGLSEAATALASGMMWQGMSSRRLRYGPDKWELRQVYADRSPESFFISGTSRARSRRTARREWGFPPPTGARRPCRAAALYLIRVFEDRECYEA